MSGKISNTRGPLRAPTRSSGGNANQANPPLTNQELDDLQALIGLLGFLPGLGIGADLINAVISAIRGDFMGALFDLFSAIPAIGDAAKGAKVIKDIDKYLGVVNRLQNTVIKKIPNKTIANKLQKVLNEAKEELNKQKLSNKKQETGKGNNQQQKDKKPNDTTVKGKPKLKCGQSGTYKELKKSTGDNKYDRDHIPSKAALKKHAEKLKGKKLSDAEKTAIDDAGWTIAIPKQAHKEVSPTYGKRNESLIKGDADDLAKAAQRDIEAMRDKIDKYDKGCAKKYKAETEKILKKTNADYDRMLKDILGIK